MRALIAGAFVLLAFAGDGRATAAATQWVRFKEDDSGNVTGYWMITDDTHDNTPAGLPLINKILRERVRRLPDFLPVSQTYYVYAECNGDNRHPVEQRRPLTPFMTELVLKCR